MPMIYMSHPRHGKKIAICEMEAEADEQNGWSRYTLEKPEPAAKFNLQRRRRTPVQEVLTDGYRSGTD